MLFIEPMLAAPLMPSKVEHTDSNIYEQMSALKYPVLATLKKDGIRGVRIDRTLKSRTRELIPNESIRKRAENLPGGFDMELWTPDLEYNDIQSIVMSEEHSDSWKIQFHLIDWFGREGGYVNRVDELLDWELQTTPRSDVVMPVVWECATPTELLAFFLKCEQEHGEGICFRLPDSLYKQGRSTLIEQYLVKLSRYVYEEAVISGFEEQYANCNPDKRNALGRMKRSSSAANLFPKSTLGALVCHLKSGVVVRVATGMKDVLRKRIWINQDKYLGKTITLKHKPHGALIKPRSPIFVGFREEGF
jgi:DNA ligase-1